MRDYFSFKAKELLGKIPVKKGDVILTSEPFAYVIDNIHRGEYCDNCLASHTVKVLKACKTCGFVWYCSEYCSIVGSDVHKYECFGIKRVDPYIPTSFARLMVRVINRLKNGGDKFVETYNEKKTRKFKDLMNHYRDIRNDEKAMKDVQEVRKEVASLIGTRNVPPDSDFVGLYGRILVNRFCLMDGLMCPMGSSVYIAGSIFDHSCVPNAYASFQGKNLVIRSLVDWTALDLNKVFISYVDRLTGTFYRRTELRTHWYFWCQCSLCNNKDTVVFENNIKCENPLCELPVQVPEKPESLFMHEAVEAPECTNCGCSVSEERLEQYHSAVAYTRHRLKTLNEDSPAMDLCLSVLERQGDIFSNFNVWRVKAFDAAFNAAYFNGLFASALDYGTANLEAMRIYYDSSHPTLGLFLMKLGKILLYVRRHKEGLAHVKESEKILTVTLGPKHDLVAVEIQSLKVMANEDVEILIESRMAEQEAEKHSLVCKHCGRRKGGKFDPARGRESPVREVTKKTESFHTNGTKTSELLATKVTKNLEPLATKTTRNEEFLVPKVTESVVPIVPKVTKNIEPLVPRVTKSIEPLLPNGTRKAEPPVMNGIIKKNIKEAEKETKQDKKEIRKVEESEDEDSDEESEEDSDEESDEESDEYDYEYEQNKYLTREQIFNILILGDKKKC